MSAVARAEAKREIAVLEIMDKLLDRTVRRKAKASQSKRIEREKNGAADD